MSSTATSTYTTTTRHTLSRRKGPGLGALATASTPNLNQLYSSSQQQQQQQQQQQGPSLPSQSHSQSRLAPPPSLARKASLASLASLAQLTQNSLASIPDDTEAYAYNSVLTNEKMPAPLTPGRPAGAGDDLAVGDAVDVPGNMHGTVRFLGPVAGRKGIFAGVELHPDFAVRGKNSGDVDGVYYFTTNRPGAGIFLPLSKAAKRESESASSGSSYPLTPNTLGGGLKVASQNSTNYTPPTPSLPKFSQSVGPGAYRPTSPMGKKPPRVSLPRPESPVRRLQLATPRPSMSATPGPGGQSKVPARYGSPTTHKFAQSVRGTAGDPSKRGITPAGGRERKASIGPRSASALGNITGTSGSTPTTLTDDETTPVGIQRTKTPGANGSLGSVSSFNLKLRPASRATNVADQEEMERLKSKLEDRDRQLKEQASALAEMESNLTELQSLIEQPDGPLGGMMARRGSVEDKDATQLRALLREKNDKIAMLTAEFDAHRADFRSTIDTLEMASTETERVYEKKIEELMQEVHDLQDRTADVDNVASQLKQLEELVQELEEGLEDARRGEAEARGEVEFLRGEVERTRSELRREREKASAAINGGSPGGNGNRISVSKELEQKEDEIRGLKAIIHSLSRDSVPGGGDAGEKLEDRVAREKLEREVAELRSLVNSKTSREEDLERELETLRRGGMNGNNNRGSVMTVGSNRDHKNQRSSLRDSRGTVVLAPPRSPETHHKGLRHSRGPTLDTMPESDAYSTATENSTLWCEICETAGHDILTCTNMFGPGAGEQNGEQQNGRATPEQAPAKTGKDVVMEGLKGLTIPSMHDDGIRPPPLSPLRSKTTLPPSLPVRILPNPMESGPVAGKDSGVVDAGKWCALCERDGHDSVDCPFEDAF